MNAQFLIDLAEVMANAVEELQRGDVRHRAIAAHLKEYRKEIVMLAQTWREPVPVTDARTSGVRSISARAPGLPKGA